MLLPVATWPELLSILIAAGDGFSGWASLNDTIMGGRSSGECSVNSEGLLMQAEVVAEGGGFVSCRSPVWQPPLDLSSATALRLRLEGDGRRYKLAVAVSDLAGRLGDLVPGGLRWVEDFDTQPSGISGSTLCDTQYTKSWKLGSCYLRLLILCSMLPCTVLVIRIHAASRTIV